jgi:hypothetical protein
MRTIYATLFAGVVLVFAHPVRASSDFRCEPEIKATAARFSDCNSTALISPSNDTRVNLALLMIDRHETQFQTDLPKSDPATVPPLIVPFGWRDFSINASIALLGSEEAASSYWTGEGSVCVSKDSGQSDFIAALASLPNDEKILLGDARKALTCGTSESTATKLDIDKRIRSNAGKDLLAYLHATERFYGGTYEPAQFIALSKRKQPWVREAARYMIGRTWALVSQSNGYGRYGEINHEDMDALALDNAASALKAYADAYPHGRYTASAYGLLRRVHWLAGNNDKLLDAYNWQITQMDSMLRNVSETVLAQEIDAKLPLEAYTANDSDPILLAVDDLRRMRHSGSNDDRSDTPAITRETLEAQRSRFVGQEALFEYLLAAHAYYVDNAPQRVLQLIPPVSASKRMGYLQFSRAALRALALDATDDAGARDALLALITRATLPYQRQTAEIALAMHDEGNHSPQRLFDADSLITDPWLRQRLLKYVAGPEQLRARVKDLKADANERDIALFVLLYKQLTRQNYAAFIADARMLPPSTNTEPNRYNKLGDVPAFDDFRWAGTTTGYLCPKLSDIAAALAKSPQASRPALCLAEFARLNGYDHFELDAQPPTDELGGQKSLFPGNAFSRQAIYKRVIASPNATAEDKAYALFRAVNCYAPSGANDCGGEDAPMATRKAWFNQLKSNYAASSWAKQLEYYW